MDLESLANHGGVLSTVTVSCPLMTSGMGDCLQDNNIGTCICRCSLRCKQLLTGASAKQRRETHWQASEGVSRHGESSKQEH